MKIHGRKTYKPGPRDECGTPPYAIVPLINYIEKYRKTVVGVRRSDFTIWEPATGMLEDKYHTGIVDGLEKIGYQVYHDRFQDFLTRDFDDINRICKVETGQNIHMIVTNPPFSVSLKRGFVKQCEEVRLKHDVPWALLMNTTTLTEKVIGRIIRGCAVHVPFGRICFNMPNKGWGTPENPTKATFTTNWFSLGLTDRYAIRYSNFDMSDHFVALEKFNRYAEKLFGGTK